MFKRFFKKKKEIENHDEVIRKIREKYKKELKNIDNKFYMKKKELKENYERKTDKNRLFEAQLTLEDILGESENGQHPLEYTIKRKEGHGKIVTFIRSKQSPNPYVIEVDEHKNCLFLSVRNQQTAEDKFIVLYYDKVKQRYSEFNWNISCEELTKHKMRSFLYDMLKHTKEESFVRYPYYVSEFQASHYFWNQEHDWKTHYELDVEALMEEKETEIDEIQQKFNEAIKPYQKENTYMTPLAQPETRKEESDRFETLFRSNQIDEDISLYVQEVYYDIYQLYRKKETFDIESSYQIETLYKKDIHQVWETYMELTPEKQKEEKHRFLTLLTKMKESIGLFEMKLQSIEEYDYEKSMNYLENKYK